MSGSTRQRNTDIQDAAAAIVANRANGIDDLTATTAKRLIVAMAHELTDDTHCVWDTARSHIAQALRCQPERSGWGGDRTQPKEQPRR